MVDASQGEGTKAAMRKSQVLGRWLRLELERTALRRACCLGYVQYKRINLHLSRRDSCQLI